MTKQLLLLSLFALFTSTAVATDDAASEKKVVRKSPVVKAAFSPFTGKIRGDKVRVRLQPDLEGYIAKELNDHDLVAVIDQEGDYWCIQPPEGVRAFVFRSFVLDDIVEGNRVNVRLDPDLEAPIIGHLNTGDHVKGVVSSVNKKWLEIDPPSQARFYIAKEFIQNVGGPEFKELMEKRKIAVQELLDKAKGLAREASHAPFEEIDFDHLKECFQIVINEYDEFGDKVLQAKEGLASVHELYLTKRISYLEGLAMAASASIDKTEKSNKPLQTSQRRALWEPIEEALYLSWARTHDQRNLEEYYEDQRLTAAHLSGTLEPFISPIKNKPGDYLLRDGNLPVAYLYSTKIDLGEYVGKKVTLVGSTRPSNHFAFPTFFVHNIE